MDDEPMGTDPMGSLIAIGLVMYLVFCVIAGLQLLGVF